MILHLSVPEETDIVQELHKSAMSNAFMVCFISGTQIGIFEGRVLINKKGHTRHILEKVPVEIILSDFRNMESFRISLLS